MSPDEMDAYMWEFDAHRTALAPYKKDQAIETARKMKLRGYSVDVIADITNLTPDEISKI